MKVTEAPLEVPQMPKLVKSKLLYADVLRCLATFAVIVIHVSYLLFYSPSGYPLSYWLAVNFWESCSRWAVPIFFMLSGLLLLDPAREESIKSVLLKRVPELVIPLFLWSELYLLWINRQNIVDRQPFSFVEGLKWIYQKEVFLHLWFVYVLIGIYLALPLLRLISKHATREVKLYAVAVWLVFNGFLGFVERYYEMPIGVKVPVFNIYIGYFLLGSWLNELVVTRRQQKCLGIAGVISFLTILLGTLYFKIADKKSMLEYFYDYSSLTVIVLSVAVFYFVSNAKWGSAQKGNYWPVNILKKTSELTFGIYLSHLLVIEILVKGWFFRPIQPDLVHPLLGIPLLSLAVFGICWLLASLLRAVPGLRWLAP